MRERLAAAGDGAVIRPPFCCDFGFNIRLGDDAVVGAGSVVIRDVASGATVAGTPARAIDR